MLSKLKEYRTEKKVEIATLCKVLSVSEEQYSKIEMTEETNIKFDHLLKLAVFYKVPIHSLVTDKEIAEKASRCVYG